MQSMRILRKPEVEKKTGLSGVTIWRKERRGDFPHRIRISDNAVGWNEAEIDAWLESRTRGMAPAPCKPAIR